MEMWTSGRAGRHDNVLYGSNLTELLKTAMRVRLYANIFEFVQTGASI